MENPKATKDCREMRDISPNFFQIRRVYNKNKADIILSRRGDLCDYLALGIYCLECSLYGMKDMVISVYFSSGDFSGDSGFQMFADGKEWVLPQNSLEYQTLMNLPQIIKYMLDEERYISKLYGISIYVPYVAHVYGVFKNENLAKEMPMLDSEHPNFKFISDVNKVTGKIFPRAYDRMRNTILAQLFARAVIRTMLKQILDP